MLQNSHIESLLESHNAYNPIAAMKAHVRFFSLKQQGDFSDYVYCASGTTYSLILSLFMVEGTVSQEDYANQMEAAQKELKIAWSILENESNCLIEKANTLCALGEVALRRGWLVSPAFNKKLHINLLSSMQKNMLVVSHCLCCILQGSQILSVIISKHHPFLRVWKEKFINSE